MQPTTNTTKKHTKTVTPSLPGRSVAPESKRPRPRHRRRAAAPLSQSSIFNAVRVLLPSRGILLSKSETKYQGVRVSPYVYDTPDVSGVSPFVNPLTTYRFRLGGHATIDTVSGVINTFVAADPSSNGWNSNEWSTLSALFSEFRLVELRVQIVRSNWFASGTATAPMPTLAVCSNLGTAVAPGSYTAVADNADAILFAPNDTTAYGHTHKMKGTGLGWSQVTTPTTEPFAGAPGSIQIYGAFASSSTVGFAHLLVSGIYEFRIRV